MSSKLELRNTVLDFKNRYGMNRNKQNLVQAAVVRGVYYGIGGTKMIPLIPYCNVISDVVSYITKAKIKMNGNIVDDVAKLRETLIENVTEIASVELNMYGKNPTISLVVFQNIVYVNLSANRITNKDLAKITVAILENIRKSNPLIYSYKNVIEETVEVYMYYLDRKSKNWGY